MKFCYLPNTILKLDIDPITQERIYQKSRGHIIPEKFDCIHSYIEVESEVDRLFGQYFDRHSYRYLRWHKTFLSSGYLIFPSGQKISSKIDLNNCKFSLDCKNHQKVKSCFSEIQKGSILTINGIIGNRRETLISILHSAYLASYYKNRYDRHPILRKFLLKCIEDKTVSEIDEKIWSQFVDFATWKPHNKQITIFEDVHEFVYLPYYEGVSLMVNLG